MAINFPISPLVGDQYTYNGKTWQWDGSYWIFLSSTNMLSSATTVGGGVSIISGISNSVLYLKSLTGGVTDNGNTISISGGTSSGSTSTSFTGGTVTGPTNFTGGLSANTFSATTYQNLPTDVRVTGATYSNNNFTFTNNTGGTFSVLFNTVTGLTTNGNLSVTGTTSSGTISATTYQNLPVSGLTQGSNITITNNGSGNFTISSTAGGGTFTGGTVTGATNFTGGLSANTFSATTITTTGLTGSVALISQRNAIPTSLRYWGMLCEVYADTNPDNNGTYKLTYNYANTTLSDNNNWALSLDAYSLTLCF